SSIRFAVPKRLVTIGNRLPFTRLNSSAGPPRSITRRGISATSRYGSTSTSIETRSFSPRRRSRKERRFRCIRFSSVSSVVRNFTTEDHRECKSLLAQTRAVQIQFPNRNNFHIRKLLLQIRQKVFRISDDYDAGARRVQPRRRERLDVRSFDRLNVCGVTIDLVQRHTVHRERRELVDNAVRSLHPARKAAQQARLAGREL